MKSFDKVPTVEFAGFTFKKKDFKEFIKYLRSGGKPTSSAKEDVDD